MKIHPKNYDLTKINLGKTTKIAIIIVILGFAGNLAFSLLTTDKSILQSLHVFRPTYFGLAVVLALVPWLTNTLRLLIWTRFLGKKIKFSELFQIILSADLGAAISPTAIGGGYVKLGMLVKKGFTAGAATSLMSLGSVEDGLFFAVAIPLSIYLSRHKAHAVFQQIIHSINWQVIRIPIIVVLVLVALLVLGRIIFKRQRQHHPLGEKLKTVFSKGWTDFKMVYLLIGKSGKKRFLLSMVFTAIQWTCRYSVISALSASFHLPVDPVLFFLFQWITFTLMTMIPTPGATAGAEAAFFMVYASLIPKEYIGFMTAGWRFMTFYFQLGLAILILGIFYLAAVFQPTPTKIQHKAKLGVDLQKY